MSTRIMGLETEYAIGAPRHDGVAWSPSLLADRLLRLARERQSHVSGAGPNNLYLPNGARLYLDAGSHPEYCTPEVSDPADCVRHVLAGEALLRDLALELRAGPPAIPALTLLRCNVDYAQPGITWGVHESYHHTGHPATVTRELLPHLVSRVYTCAGGLDPLCPGIALTMSPRLHVFSRRCCECVHYGGRVSLARGICNPRDESFARRGHRLHIICADNVNSQTALWLRMGTTCLVVALAEAGLHPGRAVQLRQPVAALHALLRDPSFQATALLANGHRLTALEIQRHYLAQVEQHLGHPGLPDWAPRLCAGWRAMLDGLEAGAHHVADRLDWPIKHALFLDHVRRRGLDPARLPHWNSVLAHLPASEATDVRSRNHDLLRALALALNGTAGRRLAAELSAHGLERDELPVLLAVRSELCEIDLRFGQIVPAGIFAALERGLDHPVVDVASIDAARTTPPHNTRAAARGAWIRKLAGRAGCVADWDHVHDGGDRTLDLPDPGSSRGHWRKACTLARLEHAAQRLEQTYCAYEQGDYERAHRLLQCQRRLGTRTLLPYWPQYVSYFAWIQSRRGYLRQALAALARYAARSGSDVDVVRDYITAYRFQGLGPSDASVWGWIRRGDALVPQECWGPGQVAEFLGHKGFILARSGQPEAGLEALTQACQNAGIVLVFPRLRARLLADRADVLRMVGRVDEASRCLDEADAIHAQHDFRGERAELVLTYRAKLASDRTRALALLSQAARIQRRLCNRIGSVRTLLLAARLDGDGRSSARRRAAIVRLQQQVPDLQTCPRLRHVLAQWDDWVAGVSPRDSADRFWLI